jgi:FlhB-like protein
MAEKTEQPTAKQLRKAREQGDVAVSAVLGQAVAFVAVLAVLPAAVGAASRTVLDLFVLAAEGRTLTAFEVAQIVLVLSLPVIGVAAFAFTALTFAMTGGNVALARVQPRLSRLSLVQGFLNLFSLARLFSLVRALVGAALAGALAFLVLKDLLGSLGGVTGEISLGLALAGRSSRSLLWYAAAIGLALGAIDFGIVWATWRKRWMMTRDEVKREYRESEGDPEVRAARRRAHQEALVSNTLFAVREASVVIVNPTHLAAALRYDEAEDGAPRLVAEGRGDVAQKIVEAAHQYGVPVVRDVPLAHALLELTVGDEIPEALYEAVAEILREVWETEQG